MIQPKPFKFVCLQCGYSKVVTPKSDVLHPSDLSSTCPKCKTKMERKGLSFLDKMFS